MNAVYKILRVVAFILMGLTVGMTLLGAIGSTCVAFRAESYDSMLPLVPVKWLYQLLILISLAAGVAGIRALVGLVKGRPWSYRDTLIVLLVGGGAALVQVIVSRALRGKSMPTDVRLWITLFTLAVFLLLRIQRVWNGLGLLKGGSPPGIAGGAAAIVLGILTLTVQIWAGPTHTFNGVNYADVWHTPLALVGWGSVLLGVALVGREIAVSFSAIQPSAIQPSAVQP